MVRALIAGTFVLEWGLLTLGLAFAFRLAAVEAPEVLQKFGDGVRRHGPAAGKIVVREFLHRPQSSLSNARTSSASWGRPLAFFISMSAWTSKTSTTAFASAMRLVCLPFKS